MNAFVLDCSVAMSWCFEDETSPLAEQVLDALLESQALVPELWSLEVANALLMAERRGRVTLAHSSEFIAQLGSFAIHVDEPKGLRVFEDVLKIARSHGLTAYDATYLELAMRKGMKLATQDVELRRAANEAGVALFS